MTASTTAAIAPGALYPPSISPPAAPLPLWKFLPTFVRNPLLTLPVGVYTEDIYSPANMGGRVAWVTDPALVERVLLGEHQIFPKSRIEHRIFSSILGDGILTAEGQSWRWQRRTVAPLFRHQEIVALVPAMSRVAETQVAAWRRLSPGTRREIEHEMTEVTFSVLAATLFSGATAEEEARLKHHIGAYLERTSWEIAYEILRLPEWLWHPAKGAMRRHARGLRATMAEILSRERARGFPGGGLMARLGEARDPETGEPMSDGLICSNLLTFAAAGHETTAKALGWTLYLLARAPDWQTRVRDEVRAVAGDGPITPEHLDRLEITRRVLKEAMRLFPPAPVIGRMAAEPVTIAGHHFKPGAMIVVPVWAIHRHRRLWEDPERFDPDRFLPEREEKIARTQYMPFGFGPRTCIGMGFAMMEAVALLASFVRGVQFDWDGRHLPEPVSRVTLRAKGGIPLLLSPA